MGKDGFLTPKAIANRIKVVSFFLFFLCSFGSPLLTLQAKGLQKLRWYCQMCQKQCRDENGFKVRCFFSRAAGLTVFCDSAIARRTATCE